jgi:hypothetical protein
MGILHPEPPRPIKSSYTPRASIKRIPARAPVEEILEVLENDGGVILSNLVSVEQLSAIEEEIEVHQKSAPTTENSALHIIPKQTLVIPGLVGKSQTVAKLCELPVLEQLRTHILQDKFTIIREGNVEENCIDPLLSISITLNVGYGAPRQILHRDDNVHGIKHATKFELNKASQFACLIAATKTTRENGATMFIPGSHKWDDERRPLLEEVCFAGELHSYKSYLSSRAKLTNATTRNGTWIRTHFPRFLLSWWWIQHCTRRRPQDSRIVLHQGHPTYRRESIPSDTKEQGAYYE